MHPLLIKTVKIKKIQLKEVKIIVNTINIGFKLIYDLS